MRSFFDKLKSRKFLLTIASIALGIIYPPIIPVLKILTPTYVGAEGIADAAGALYVAIKKSQTPDAAIAPGPGLR